MSLETQLAKNKPNNDIKPTKFANFVMDDLKFFHTVVVSQETLDLQAKDLSLLMLSLASTIPNKEEFQLRPLCYGPRGTGIYMSLENGSQF